MPRIDYPWKIEIDLTYAGVQRVGPWDPSSCDRGCTREGVSVRNRAYCKDVHWGASHQAEDATVAGVAGHLAYTLQGYFKDPESPP